MHRATNDVDTTPKVRWFADDSLRIVRLTNEASAVHPRMDASEVATLGRFLLDQLD